MTKPLGPHARALLSRAVAWSDGRFDPGRGLPEGPIREEAGVQRVHFVPQAAWYAFGLLSRDGPGDRERATGIVDTLLSLQHREPALDEGQPWYGSFSRFADTPQPREGAVAYRDYDPNWRQFIGTAFLLTLAAFEERLGDARVRAIEESLALCVRGEPEDRVPAAYSNIALMRALLESEAGRRLGEPSWSARGEALGAEVVSRFDRHGAFEEYNSPTYYGIDLFALAAWRQCASADALRSEGARLEAALWRDLSRWYHPGLRNLCGPYSRTYGMDMRRYVGMLGLWIAFGLDLDADAAPLPPIEPGAELVHGHDLYIAPLVAWLGAAVPEDAEPGLRALDAPRDPSQRLSDAEERTATGRLEPRWMMGGETCSSDRSGNEQYVPATLHWRLPDGEAGWLYVRAPGPSRARIDGASLRIDVAAGEGPVRVVLRAPGLGAKDLEGDVWRLPGLSLSIDAGAATPDVEVLPRRTHVSFGRDGSRPGSLALTPFR